MSEEGAEQKYIKKAFDDNYVVPLWPNVDQFEAELEAFVGQEKRVLAIADKYGIPVIEDAAGVLRIPDSPVTDCQPNDNVEALRVYLDNAGIEARPLWKPMHKQPVYVGADVYTNGVEVELFKVGMCLPSGPCVSDEDVAYIVDCIKRACRIDG